MNGELAQRMALVGWGNEMLAGRVDTDLDDHDTLRFVRSVTFEGSRRRRWRSPKTATSVHEWIADLTARQTDHLELDALGQLLSGHAGALDPQRSAGFANSTGTPILAVRSSTAEVWRSTWSVGRDDRPADDRIWDVVYEPLGEIDDPRLSHPSVETATGQLAASLDAIHHFALTQDTGHWIGWFADARELLTSPEPVVPYHPQLLPDHGLEHSRLTAALTKAWVFGGMGSWNDLGFGEPDVDAEYRAVTGDLYAAVMAAADAVTNLQR